MFILSAQEEKIDFEGFTFKYILKNRTYDTNHLIVVFSGFGAKSSFTYDFLNALKSSRAYVLWIKDDFYDNGQATYYIDPIYSESNKLEQAISKFLEKIIDFLNVNRENCTLLGASKGGSSALYYGIKYNFRNILLSAPTLLIGSSVAGITPKGLIKSPAKFMLGSDLSSDNIKKLDSIILNQIKNDNDYDRNIYLISSKADNRFLGQIQPFLGYFYKYFNFNFIESQSLLVRSHQDVTSHNTPLILSILGCLCYNLPPAFRNSIIHSDKLCKVTNITKEPILRVDKISFDDNGLFYVEGVFFLRGVSCAYYHDLKYTLKLKSPTKNYEILLAKDNKPQISKTYYEGNFVNYDKAYFCTNKHKGLNMSHISPGLYKLYVEINMLTGEVCEVPLQFNVKINNNSSTSKYSESVFTEENAVFYKKFEF